MADGVGFPFPSLLLNEGRTYGQPEVVLISLPRSGNRSALTLAGLRSVSGAFSQTCSCRRRHSCAEGVPTASPNQKKMLSEINAGYGRKGIVSWRYFTLQ